MAKGLSPNPIYLYKRGSFFQSANQVGKFSPKMDHQTTEAETLNQMIKLRTSSPKEAEQCKFVMARRRATTTGMPGKRFSLAGGQSDYAANNNIDTKSTANEIAFQKGKSEVQKTSPALLLKSRTLVKPNAGQVNQKRKNTSVEDISQRTSDLGHL